MPVIEPTVVMLDTRAIYIGPGLNLSPHRNAVATVAIGLTREFELKVFADDDSSTSRTRVTVIPPQTDHLLLSNGEMMFVYLDALNDDWSKLGSCDRDWLEFGVQIQELVTKAPKSIARSIDLIALRFQTFGLSPPVREGRLHQTIEQIYKNPQDFNSVKDAAALANLSASRFQHVFKAQVGLPFRQYRLWCRMTQVVRHLMAGDSLTEAAVESGFSSSAHLSSSFRRMFGIKPSDLLTIGTHFYTKEPDIFPLADV